MNHYKGLNKSNSYFEGWYLKHQNKDQTIIFIPGINIEQNGKRLAFIQVITDHKSYHIPYDFSDFKAKNNKFSIKVKDNIFNEKGIKVNIVCDGLTVKGVLRYDRFTQLKYSIMGPFALIPSLECNHGVISMGHKLKGKLIVKEEITGKEINIDESIMDELQKEKSIPKELIRKEAILKEPIRKEAIRKEPVVKVQTPKTIPREFEKKLDFTNGIGYIEKDWGNSFPSKYLWSQGHGLEDDQCSIMVAIANIPFRQYAFSGCICVVSYNGKEYRLATYLGVKIEWWNKSGLLIRQRGHILKVRLVESNKHPLFAPVRGEMNRTIHENASCKVRYSFWVNEILVFDFVSNQASFEYSNS